MIFQIIFSFFGINSISELNTIIASVVISMIMTPITLHLLFGKPKKKHDETQ